MNAAAVIARKELLQRLRDRTAWIVGLVAPFVLAALIGLAVGNIDQSARFTIGVVDLDGSHAARSFVVGLQDDPDARDALEIREIASVTEAEELADAGDVAAAIVIPAGFGASLASGAAPDPLRVVRSADHPIGADVAESIADGFAAQVDAVRLSVVTALDLGADSADLAGLAARAAATAPPVRLEQQRASANEHAEVSQWAPAMAILFLFFTIGLGARSLLVEREQGTMARLLVAPITGRQLLGGKAMATFVLGVTSMMILAFATSLTVRADWGDPLSALALIVATVFAVMGVLALLLTFAKTQRQAAAYTSVVAFGFALLGGNFVNLSQAPSWLRALTLVTPNGWALRAFADLSADHGGLTSVLEPLLAIVAFGVVTISIALARADRLVRL